MDILKNNIVVGLGVAVAATVLAPLLLPALGGVGRPLAKSLVKGGMALFEKGRESLALAGESLEDLMAEVRAEAGRQPAHGGAPAGGTVPQGEDGAPPRAHAANGASNETTAQSAGSVGI